MSVSLGEFARDVAALVEAGGGDAAVARGVAARLPTLLADPALLAPEQRLPGADGYSQHILHVDPSGRFSVVALVWGPGQATPPHDHVAWCVVGVYDGEEVETTYRAGPGSPPAEVATARHRRGDVTWLVPGGAGDVHRVENPTDRTAISIHVYGADIARLGTSIRTRYGAKPGPDPRPAPPPDTLNERVGVLTRREVEARILAPIVDALGREFGRERVIEVVRRAIVETAREQGRQMAARRRDASLSAFADTLEAWTRDDALRLRVLERSGERLSFDVTRCRYAELYRALGIPELGAVLSCNRDFALIEGFNPDVALTRTQTIMQGATHCDFRYVAGKKEE
jgi:predicted metal-dependent enzyme (double-stranded beta helix superfamily)